MDVFSAADVHRLLPYDVLVPSLIDAHKQSVDQSRSVVLSQPANADGENNFLALPAWQHDRAIGAKLVTVFPENEKNGSGLPSVQALYTLFSGIDGRPLAVIDGTALTLRKTAADSAMGSVFLAREDAETMGMIGAGAMAPHLIEAHMSARPTLKRILIWNRSPERARRLAQEMRARGVDAVHTEDLREASGCDVVSCATMAVSPLVRGDWLRPGAHLDLVGSFRTDMHECDMDAMARGRVFVDSRWSAIADAGEIQTALKEGVLTESDIVADAFELGRGTKQGRRDPAEVTIFKNGGGGHLDLMVSQILAARAAENND